MTTEDLETFFSGGWNRHDVDALMPLMSDEVNRCDLFTFRDGKIAVKSSYFKTRTA